MEREKISIKPIRAEHHHKLTSSMTEHHVKDFKFKKAEVEFEDD